MTAITLLPAALLMMTAFTRIIIVLSILRQAIGAGQSPPNQVLIGLALFLTLFVMSPVIDKIRTDAVTPYMAGTIDTTTALERGVVPLKTFMLEQTRESDIASFVRISGGKGYDSPQDVPLTILAAGVRHQRAEDRLSDRFSAVHSVRDHRSGGRQCADVDGHDDALAGADLAAVQAHAVRAGRRLDAGDGFAGLELLSLRPLHFTKGLAMTPETVMTIGQRALE
jgi:hypothetical protein